MTLKLVCRELMNQSLFASWKEFHHRYYRYNDIEIFNWSFFKGDELINVTYEKGYVKSSSWKDRWCGKDRISIVDRLHISNKDVSVNECTKYLTIMHDNVSKNLAYIIKIEDILGPNTFGSADNRGWYVITPDIILKCEFNILCTGKCVKFETIGSKGSKKSVIDMSQLLKKLAKYKGIQNIKRDNIEILKEKDVKMVKQAEVKTTNLSIKKCLGYTESTKIIRQNYNSLFIKRKQYQRDTEK